MNLADTFFNTSVLADSIGSLLAGFRLTALLGATSLVLATALGCCCWSCCACTRSSRCAGPPSR